MSYNERLNKISDLRPSIPSPELCNVAVREKEIPNKLNQLDSALQGVERLIEALQSKLVPVIGKQPVERKGQATSPSGTALGGNLQNFIDRAYMSTGRLEEILDGLEI